MSTPGAAYGASQTYPARNASRRALRSGGCDDWGDRFWFPRCVRERIESRRLAFSLPCVSSRVAKETAVKRVSGSRATWDACNRSRCVAWVALPDAQQATFETGKLIGRPFGLQHGIAVSERSALLTADWL